MPRGPRLATAAGRSLLLLFMGRSDLLLLSPEEYEGIYEVYMRDHRESADSSGNIDNGFGEHC